MDEISETTGAAWRKSSFSNGNGNDCVEVADRVGGGLFVRDSKDPAGGVLSFSATEWRAFVRGTKAGEFE